MSEIDHLSFDKLLSYCEDQLKSSEINEIEGHLATCNRCIEVFTALKSLNAPISQSIKDAKVTSSCPEDWEIGALIKEERESETSDKIARHIKDCDFCTDRAAVYYKALSLEQAPIATPQSWKVKAAEAIKTEESNTAEVKAPLLQRILDFFQDLAPAPVAAGLAAALLAIAVIFFIYPSNKTATVTIASNEKIVIRDSEVPSSFGFTGAGKTIDVSNMKITLNGSEVILQWKPIEKAAEYKFLLKDRDKEVYSVKTGRIAIVTLNKEIFESRIPYNWLISGKTADNKYFEYTGSFVLSK